MKKIKNFGKKIKKSEQKLIKGGTGDGGGCLPPMAHCEPYGLERCCPGYICSRANWNDDVCFYFQP